MPKSTFTESGPRRNNDDSFACLLDVKKCVELLREIRWPDGMADYNGFGGGLFS